MRTKTRYRRNNNNSGQDIPVENKSSESPAENIPEVTIDREETPVAAASFEVPADADTNVAHAVEAAARADDAALALRNQLEIIRRQEEAQRQQAAQVAAQHAQPLTREQKLATWKATGLSEAEHAFLQANPELIDHDALTAYAAGEATKHGHERGSESHMEKTKEIFYGHLARMQEQAAAAANPATQPTPEFFKPPPAKPVSTPSPASFVSAPVSRDIPSSVPRELSPSQVRLTPDEIEHARVSGVDLKTYAKHKIELDRQKRAGLRQNG